MAYHLFYAKTLLELIMTFYQLDLLETNFSEIQITIQLFLFKKIHLEILSAW